MTVLTAVPDAGRRGSPSLEVLAREVIGVAREGSVTLGCAESLTGGLVAGALTEVPGASAVVRGAVVSYATSVKAAVLGVPGELLRERGAVDPEVAVEMARGACRVLGCDAAVATTGVAGPDPADGREVGTVYVAAVRGAGVVVRHLRITGSRARIRKVTVAAALAVLGAVVATSDPPTR